MDAKRKANGAFEDDERGAKRQKVPDVLPDLDHGETPETTFLHGLVLLDLIKNTRDKGGRLAATDFMTLPSRKDFPEYYEVTKMPIAIDTVEEKMYRREFPNLTSLESYWKRMVANAKHYNVKGSEIHKDAERIRKVVASFMLKTNPAYKDPLYTAFPTPIPPELENPGLYPAGAPSDVDAEGESDDEVNSGIPAKRRPGRPPKDPVAFYANKRSSITPARSEPSYTIGGSFDGLAFQQAQEKIIEEMIRHKKDEDDEFPRFEPFISLPPRSMKEYYKIILHPVSLNSLKKHVKPPSGVSEFKSWKVFEEEVAALWQNAWHFNMDGSDIYTAATELKEFFEERLALAKKAVQEPAQPKLKLKVSAPEATPRITLRMGSKGSPIGSAVQTPISNGVSEISNIGTAVPKAVSQLEAGASGPGSIVSPTPSTNGGIKNEDGYKQSPPVMPISGSQSITAQHPSSLQLNGNSMLPPSSSYTNGLHVNGVGNHSYGQTYTPTSVFDSKWRHPGKDASDALIANLTLSTHPGLNISRHFQMDILPSADMAQQSVTINLPATHYYLQIKPVLSNQLLGRHHKVFVTSGTQRLNAMPLIAGNSIDQMQPLFEARLLPGVNRIEVEVIAGMPKGTTGPPGSQDVEFEKVTIFANLLR